MNVQTALFDDRRMGEVDHLTVATGTPASELIEHEQNIDKNAKDLPEIRNWNWGQAKAVAPAGKRPTRNG